MYSLEASLAQQARKKKPSLDSIAQKRASLPRASFAVPKERRWNAVAQKNIDSLASQKSSLLFSREKRSWWEQREYLWRRGEIALSYMKRLPAFLMPRLTSHKMLYGSITGGIAFGMVSMAFIAHYFGAGVFARSSEPAVAEVSTVAEARALSDPLESYNPEQDIFFEYFGQVTKEKYEESIRDMVKGYPIEAMLPYIFAQDRLTAAFLIGIAKKESAWGKRIPVLDGQDCFNYWGYRGIRRMMGTGGHTCFNSRKDAVETVSRRLETLIHSEKLDTPEKMIVWKCGFSCQGHSRESVKKWIADVDMYFSQLSDE